MLRARRLLEALANAELVWPSFSLSYVDQFEFAGNVVPKGAVQVYQVSSADLLRQHNLYPLLSR
jgi:hypothetical protein